jgi:hypothetical protein
VGLLTFTWSRSPTEPRVLPPVASDVPVPAPAAPLAQVANDVPVPPALPTAPTVEPAPLGTRCVEDVATVGRPLQYDGDLVSMGLQGAAIDPKGCTIAAWTANDLLASWDGGATFARFDARPDIAMVKADPKRVVVLGGSDKLGVFRPGKTPVWRDLGAVVIPGKPLSRWLAAVADGWILLLLADGTELAVSDDDGATWRYVTPPRSTNAFDITADGRIRATAWKAVPATPAVRGRAGTHEGPPVARMDFTAHHHVFDPKTARWRDGEAALRGWSPPAWTYVPTTDAEPYSHGGRTWITARHHGREVGIVADRIGDGPIRIASNGRDTYAIYSDLLHRIDGIRSVEIDSVLAKTRDAIGVDQYGSVIVLNDAGVLRWSERGGWRWLWPTARLPAPPIAR